LVFLTADAPLDLLAGELVSGGPLARVVGNRAAIHCRQFVQAPGELARLVPATSNPERVRVGAILLQAHHVAAVLVLESFPAAAGFVAGPTPAA
jgi:hypothetical protein